MSEIKPSSWTYKCGGMPWMVTVHEPEWEPDLEVKPLYDEAALTQARADERERHQPLRQAAEDFIAKVDRGEARSKRTYAALKDAIRALDERTEK